MVPQPKWFKSEKNLKIGDIILFRKHESVLSNTYQYGRIESVETSRDGLIRKAKEAYRNFNENVVRSTYRAVRELVVIHKIDELNILQELGRVSNYATYKKKLDEIH